MGRPDMILSDRGGGGRRYAAGKKGRKVGPGHKRIAHLSNTLAPRFHTTHVFNREGKKEGETERKGLIDYEDDHERYERCGLRHGVRASCTAVCVDAGCDAWPN